MPHSQQEVVEYLFLAILVLSITVITLLYARWLKAREAFWEARRKQEKFWR